MCGSGVVVELTPSWLQKQCACSERWEEGVSDCDIIGLAGFCSTKKLLITNKASLY